MTTDETKPDDNTNMRIWDELFQVPKGSTYPIERGLCAGLTGITPLSLIKQATELWGPIGEGWGFEIEKDEIVNQDAKFHSEMLHVMTIKLWYDGALVIGEESARGSHDGRNVDIVMDATYGFGCTKLYQRRGGEWYIDDDFNKSTLTDAITNALSRLGFGGSVRLGEMQSKYTTNLDAKDSEADKAWDEVIAKRRQTTGPECISDSKDPNYVSDETLIKRGTEILESETRSGSNPAHIRLLLKERSW